MNNQNFTIDTTCMSRKQLLNVGRLIAKAGELDFPIDDSMTQVGYNTTYGNTYLWCEDIPYTIFVSDFDSKIKALYSCPYDGEEVERNCSNDEDLTLKDNICFIEIFTSIFTVKINKIDGRKSRNINYLSIWHLVEYIEKYATIDQYQKLALSLYTNKSI